MNAEIISVGAEVISGDVNNTDASYLSQRLSRLGIRVTRHTAVDDRPESITEALAAAVARTQVIIFTGGLGPTADDMTKEVVCSAVGFDLVEREESMKRLTRYFENKGEDMPIINRKQAMFPESAIVFENTVGTADGCAIESGNQCIIMLPGPPKELQTMFEGSVEDYLMGKTDSVVACRTLKVFGMGESKIAEAIAPFLAQADPSVATYVGKGDIRIKITTTGENKEDCEARCRETEGAICDILGSVVYARENITLQETVVSLLLAKGLKIATAESCTAGMLSETLTDVSGASQVFEFGVSAYANRIKNEVLGVPAAMLKKYGAVSSQVAEAMAKGAAAKGGANLGIGITGIAGPTGGTPEKPVGTVYISLYDGTRCFTRKLNCNPDSSREKIRLMAVMNALDMTRLYLQEDPKFTAPVTTPTKKKKKKKWWQTIIPLKGDKPAEVVRKIIMMVCILVFLGSAGYIADYCYQSYMTRMEQGDLSSQYHNIADISERFKLLQAQNPDTVGWLTVPGTKCDNPVVQTTNNETYLKTTFDGKKSKYGTLFADSICKFDPPSKKSNGLSTNTIVYGHHMRDGTMMGEFKKFRKYDFYKEHPVLQFTTQYDTKTVDWKILSIFIINTVPADSFDSVFNYRQVEFANKYAFNIYLNEITQRSIINTGVDAVYGDQFLTLSTCTYEFNDARLVIVARRVRDGESSQVDLSKTSINQDVVYPKAYYKKGSSGRTSVTSYVDGNTSSVTASKPIGEDSSTPANSQASGDNTPSGNGDSWSGTTTTPESRPATSQPPESTPSGETPTDV